MFIVDDVLRSYKIINYLVSMECICLTRQVMKYVVLVELKNQNVSGYSLMAAMRVWEIIIEEFFTYYCCRARFAFQSNQLKNHVNSS